MSAFLDSLSGAGYDGTEGGGIGDVGSADDPMMAPQTASSGGYFSGALQAVTALGTGYLARRMDIDLTQRAYDAMPRPVLGTTQNGILLGPAGVPRAGGVVIGQNGATMLNLNALLPFLLVGAVVFLMARR